MSSSTLVPVHEAGMSGELSEVKAIIGSMPPDDAFAGPLVGRVAELAALLELAGGSRSNGAAIIGGDAGVGKTRLLREFVDRAKSDGDLVLVGHCLHFGGDAVPYLPISEMFGRLARDAPELVDRLRELYPPIVRLLPARRVIGAPRETAAPLDRSDLFESIFGALVALSDEHPVVVVIEDMHWADSGTRDLVAFLLSRAGREQLSVVVSYRSDDLHRRHPLRPVLLEWGRLPGMVKIALGPLADDWMRTLVHLRHVGALSEHEVEGILDRAGGNAFFAEQLLAEIDGNDRLPVDLAELLLMRLDRLSDAARSVVRVAAVSGRQVSHPLIAAVAAISDGELDTALREAVDAHVLDRNGPDAYTFRHALLAEAVYDDLLPGERVRLHRSFALALVSGAVTGTDADLARHAREAMDVETAFAATVRAGDEAMRVAAPNQAMRHYESALAMVERIDRPEPGGPDLSLRAADAAAAAGHLYRALQLVKEAAGALPADADTELRTELLIAITTYALPLDSGEDFFAASAEALRLVPADSRTSMRARVLAVHARSAIAVNRDDDAVGLATEARDLGAELGLPDVEVDAATTLARLYERSANPDRAINLIELSIAQAVVTANFGAEMRGRHSLGGLHYDGGDLPAAISSLRETMTRARQGGRPWSVYGLDARVLLVQALYVSGEWDEASVLAAAEGEMPPAQAEAGLTAASLNIAAGRGTLDSEVALDTLRPWWRRDGLVALLAGSAFMDVRIERGDIAGALVLHDELIDLIVDIWQNRWFQARIRLHALALAGLARAAAGASDQEQGELASRGRRLIEDVRTTAREGITRRPVRGPEGQAWLARAEAEWLRVQWAAGVDRPSAPALVDGWRAAVDAFSYGHVFERARSQARLATALQATGDSAGAQAVADEARRAARTLGAAPLLNEIRALALRVGRDPTGDRLAAVTPREHQGPRTAGPGADQPSDRRFALHQREDRERARLQHPGQIGSVGPDRGGGDRPAGRAPDRLKRTELGLGPPAPVARIGQSGPRPRRVGWLQPAARFGGLTSRVRPVLFSRIGGPPRSTRSAGRRSRAATPGTRASGHPGRSRQPRKRHQSTTRVNATCIGA